MNDPFTATGLSLLESPGNFQPVPKRLRLYISPLELLRSGLNKDISLRPVDKDRLFRNSNEPFGPPLVASIRTDANMPGFSSQLELSIVTLAFSVLVFFVDHIGDIGDLPFEGFLRKRCN